MHERHVAEGSARGSRSDGLAERLRASTSELHREAERSGIIAALLRGRVGRIGYLVLQRNLVPAYEALEQRLQRHQQAPGVRWIARPCLYRLASLQHDLERLCGPRWQERLPLLPAARRYAMRIADDGRHDLSSLIGHAYVRHLGDLSGGRILGRLLERRLGLARLAFHRFDGIDDIELFKRSYRRDLDRAGLEIARPERVQQAALAAFRLNIEVSTAVEEAAAATPSTETAAPA